MPANTRVELRENREIKNIVTAAFPSYRKKAAYVSTFPSEVNISSYWDGGSKSYFAIVEVATMRRRELPNSTHPYYDIARRGMANQETAAVRSDHVGNVYLTQLPAGYALVESGTFCGKPATAHVYLAPRPELPAPGESPRELPPAESKPPAGVTGAELVRQLWVKACEHDAIPPDSKFVVFSDGNKYAKLYNSAVATVMRG